ncbi:hypothetical protein ZOSMA_63G00480 [Zostera marina]|uniref:F-box domain-containing protein n=1 Tax=Zostera marina TaxID=29655 RepID=A0A0K9NVC1_ZOSMR|nr:hypothetical protein ZOSMA_63G00480 [Zostera marina]
MAKTKCKLKTPKTQQDIISFLPEEVLTKILGNLSVKDAIHTSFLSKEWSYKWRSISDLTFDSDSFSTPNDREPSTLMILYLSKVLEFLFLHRGNIRTLQFNSI